MGLRAPVLALLVATSTFTSPVLAESRSSFSIVYPVVAPRVSSKFGNRIHPVRRFSTLHKGVDLAAPEFSHVRAVAAGKVVFAGKYSGFGKLVTIQHDRRHVSLYAHLGEIKVKLGQEVPAGQLIGRVGETGLATGPHLHFEWRVDGKPIDPLSEFPSLAAFGEG